MSSAWPSSTAIVLVAAGAAAGSMVRYAVQTSIDVQNSLPLATLLVNLVGAFALGVVVTTLRSVRLRELLGPGLLGGFTTYSAMALETQDLLTSDRPQLGLAYLLATVAGGYVLALAGLAAGRRWRR